MIAILPLRKNSQRLKNKNIKKINGIPLIAYSIKQAQKSKIFNKIVVSTDDKKISSISKKYNVDLVIKRGQRLSNSRSAKIPVIRDALLKSEIFFNCKFDYIVDLDATSPLRLVSDIKKSIEKILKEKKNLLFSVSEAKKNPYFNMIEKKDGFYKLVKNKKKFLIQTRQSAPKIFELNASIYIWKRKAILKKNNLFVKNNSIYVMPHERSIDIDNEFDFKIVKHLLKQ